jgi:branched-chain amino acid transport system permease protein
MIEQVFLNGLIAASVWGLIAIGFGIIFYSVRFFHFAHGAVFTAGAYFALLFSNKLALPLFTSSILSVVLSSLLGCSIYILIYRPFMRRNSSPTVLLLVSLGTYIVIQNIISLIFGDDVLSIRSATVTEGINFGVARITLLQAQNFVISVSFLIGSFLFLRKSKIGKAMRAIGAEPQLAEISGINVNKIYLITFAIGSALAGLAGILIALDVDMKPSMGMNALLMGVIVVIIGGAGSITGIALAALLLGMVQHLGVWKIGTEWQDAIVFAVLIIFLLFRPQGFLGKKVKTATL